MTCKRTASSANCYWVSMLLGEHIYLSSKRRALFWLVAILELDNQSVGSSALADHLQARRSRQPLNTARLGRQASMRPSFIPGDRLTKCPSLLVLLPATPDLSLCRASGFLLDNSPGRVALLLQALSQER